MKNHNAFKKFISKRMENKRSEVKNETSTADEVKEIETPKSEEVTELKPDVQPKDEL